MAALGAGSPPAGATGAGNPTLQAPTLLAVQDFQHSPLPPSFLQHTPVSDATNGAAFGAAVVWSTGCNGWAASAVQSPSDPTAVGQCGSQAPWNSVQQMADALGLYGGQSPTTAVNNVAIGSYPITSPGAGIVLLSTRMATVSLANRFVMVNADVATLNCAAGAPSLQFNVLDATFVRHILGSVADPCSGGSTVSVPAIGAVGSQSVHVGTYQGDGSYLMTGASEGIRIENMNGSVPGNDFAIDNVRLFDVTPRLDETLSSATSGAGGQTSTLTFSIVNTSELASKNGWSFANTLPAGLVVTGSSSTTCPGGVVDAPAGGSTISVTGNLDVGQASCDVTVTVTSALPASYTIDANDLSSSAGLGTPTTPATVTFDPAPTTTAGPSATSTSTTTTVVTAGSVATTTSTSPATSASATTVPSGNRLTSTGAVPSELSFTGTSAWLAWLAAGVAVMGGGFVVLAGPRRRRGAHFRPR